MPDSTEIRKRSRSLSDSDQQQSHKRVNTGAATGTDDTNSRTRTDSITRTSDGVNGDYDSKKDISAAGDATPVSPSSKKDEPASPTASSSAPAPPAAQIHMRCLIVTQDASIIIGKGGKHVNEIREKSGARVMVSESIPGNPERILNVSGPLDAVSKVRYIRFSGRCESMPYPELWLDRSPH